jgi:cellulose synthase/poly-beta-1,6-N-acetylglucosamine synthase-like glycosyltransferase
MLHRWHAIKPIPTDAKLSDCVSTFVVQRHAPGGKTLAPIDIGGGRRLKLTLLVKRDNRRKINAHDWMLASFAKYYKAHFVFLTDCGTLFEKDCIALLTKELSDRPHCTAVTGRQRVMTATQQGIEAHCLGDLRI